MKSTWLVIVALFPIVSFSQESLSKSRFNMISSVGVVAGESAAKPLFQLTPGISLPVLALGWISTSINLFHYLQTGG